jgi:hypothetical protein
MPDNDLNNEVELEELEENQLDPEDFGFIISADGELKSILFPEHLTGEPPEEIKEILDILGVDWEQELTKRTLH